MARKKKEIGNTEQTPIEEKNTEQQNKEGVMTNNTNTANIYPQELILRASDSLDRISGLLGAAIVERQRIAEDLVADSDALSKKMQVLDEAEAKIRAWGILNLLPEIQETRDLCVAALEAVARSDEFRIAMMAKAERDVKVKLEQDKRDAEQAARTVAAQKIKDAENSQIEKWRDLVASGIPQKAVFVWQDQVAKDGHKVVDPKTHKPKQTKVCVREAGLMPYVEVVSRRINKRKALEGVEGFYEKNDVIRSYILLIAEENGVNPAILRLVNNDVNMKDEVKEVIKAVRKYRQDYFYSLHPEATRPGEPEPKVYIDPQAAFQADAEELALGKSADIPVEDNQLLEAMMAEREEE